MAGSGAHRVDCVIPSVPVRQYVLAFPSSCQAARPEVRRVLFRIFCEVCG